MFTSELAINVGLKHLQQEPFAEGEKRVKKLEIPNIQSLLSDEMEKLKTQSSLLANKIEDLYKPQHCFSTLNTPLRNLALIITALKISTMVGIFLTATESNNRSLQVAGIALVIFSTWFEGGLNFYQHKLSLRQKQILELVAQNRYEIIQGQKYKEFAEKLEMTNKLVSRQQTEEAILQGDNSSKEEKLYSTRSNPSPPPQDDLLDSQITDCFHSYETLPLPDRKDEIYGRIFLEIIKRLPSTDPIVQAFNQLSLEANQEDLGKLAGKPLSNKYLTHSNSIGPSEQWWDSEDQPNLQMGNSLRSIEMRESSQNFNLDISYERCYLLAAQLNEQIKRRFNLERNIPYFETRDGCRISYREAPHKAGNPQEITLESGGIGYTTEDPLNSV